LRKSTDFSDSIFIVMVALFTIMCGITFCHHFKADDSIFYYHGGIFTGTVQAFSGGIFLSFKPSAFESEISPLHKLRLCNGDFALAGSKVTPA